MNMDIFGTKTKTNFWEQSKINLALLPTPALGVNFKFQSPIKLPTWSFVEVTEYSTKVLAEVEYSVTSTKLKIDHQKYALLPLTINHIV